MKNKTTKAMAAKATNSGGYAHASAADRRRVNVYGAATPSGAVPRRAFGGSANPVKGASR